VDDIILIALTLSPCFDNRYTQLIVAMSDVRRPGVFANKIGCLRSAHSWISKHVCDGWSPQRCRTFQLPFHVINVAVSKGFSPTPSHIEKYMSGHSLGEGELMSWQMEFDEACRKSARFVDTTEILNNLASAPTVRALVICEHGPFVVEQATSVFNKARIAQPNVHTFSVGDEYLDDVIVPSAIEACQFMSFHFKHTVAGLVAQWASGRNSGCRTTFDVYR
jgi:hypothetical protein